MQKRALLPLAAVVALVAVGLSGCLSDDGDVPGAGPGPAPAERLTTFDWTGSELKIDVPVPVITFGLSDDVVQSLKDTLQPMEVRHTTIEINQFLPPQPDEGIEGNLPLIGTNLPMVTVPTAHYEVDAAPAALSDEFADALDTVALSAERYSANAMEDWLADALMRYGFEPHPDFPSIVLVHLDAFGVGDHGWRFDGRTGWLEPVRVFGERLPILVLDPSAVPDCYAGGCGGGLFGGGGGPAYFTPVAPDAVGAMADMIRDATHFRILQGNIYPPSLAPCHAVTGILGIRSTSAAELTGIARAARDITHEDWIKGAFDNLTGEDVFFDLVILELPVDDPVLDAIARGEFATMDVLRAWLTLNWDQYWVEHAGCEAYVSIVFAGDVASIPTGILGIGTYDRSAGYRVSMSWVNEALRLLFDPESPICQVSCGQKEYLNWLDYLFTHESGHIMALPHTFNTIVDDPANGRPDNNAFSSIRSSMSYQNDGRVVDFGMMDHANWIRGRAGFALAAASTQGLEGSAEWDEAMWHLERLDWKSAFYAVEPVIE